MPPGHAALLLACVQPLDGSQASSVQTLPSLQLGGVPATQAPFWQVSRPLHSEVSSQAVPFEAAACMQVPAMQRSTVHGLPSLQSLLVLQVQPEIGEPRHVP